MFLVWRLGRADDVVLPAKLPLAVVGALLLTVPASTTGPWAQALGFACILGFCLLNARHRVLAVVGAGALLHLVSLLVLPGAWASPVALAGTILLVGGVAVYLWRPGLGQPYVTPPGRSSAA